MSKCALGIAIGLFTMAGSAAAQDPTAASTTTGSTDGTSTGVGNAGSFGIASGTANSLSTATATSNGIQDSSTHSLVDSGTTISTVSTQDLQATSTGNHIETSVGGATAPTPLNTGSIAMGGTSLANSTGIFNNGLNTAPASVTQADTNFAINGSIGAK